MASTWSNLKNLKDDQIKAGVESKPGVYRFSSKKADGTWVIFYVGKAIDLQKRLLEHLSPNEPNACIRNKLKTPVMFRVAYVASEEDRKNTEYTMFKKFKPLCNETEPEGKLINIDLDTK